MGPYPPGCCPTAPPYPPAKPGRGANTRRLPLGPAPGPGATLPGCGCGMLPRGVACFTWICLLPTVWNSPAVNTAFAPASSANVMNLAPHGPFGGTGARVGPKAGMPVQVPRRDIKAQLQRTQNRDSALSGGPALFACPTQVQSARSSPAASLRRRACTRRSYPALASAAPGELGRQAAGPEHS